MNPVTIVGHVNQQHQLSAAVPDSVPPGPVTIVIVPAAPEDAEGAWMEGVAKQWSDDLSDAHQDIYTLDDGEPTDAR